MRRCACAGCVASFRRAGRRDRFSRQEDAMNLRSTAAALAALLLPLPAAAIDRSPTLDHNCYNFEIGSISQPNPVRMIEESVLLGLNVRQTERFRQCIRS